MVYRIVIDIRDSSEAGGCKTTLYSSNPPAGSPTIPQVITTSRRARRGILVGWAAAASAWALGMLRSEPAQAATGDPLILGRENDTGDPTFLRNTPRSSPFSLLLATNEVSPAIHAFGRPAGLVAAGFPEGDNPGIAVVGAGEIGLHGQGSIGVRGTAGVGHGVGGNFIGVEANAAGLEGLALAVRGRAGFSTAGNSVIPAGQNTMTVTNPAVTNQSHISVTFTGDPGVGRVDWVERQPGTGFILHLNRRVTVATPFSFLITEPTSPVPEQFTAAQSMVVDRTSLNALPPQIREQVTMLRRDIAAR